MRLLIACSRLGLALAASLLTAPPAGAADWPVVAPTRAADWAYAPFDAPPATYTGEVGVRFWYGKSSTAKNLYDNTGSLLVSRLTYDGLSIFAAEAYGRFDLNRRWFLKGYVGGGTLRNGNLKDEDFPPVIVPYSATWSAQQDSSPLYANADVGNVLYGPDFRIGVFAAFTT